MGAGYKQNGDPVADRSVALIIPGRLKGEAQALSASDRTLGPQQSGDLFTGVFSPAFDGQIG
jgi:hypothetical protein